MKQKQKSLTKKDRPASLDGTACPVPTDADMLNWLDKQGAHYGWTVQLPSDYPNVRNCVFVCRNTTGGHSTIREAIAHRMGKSNNQFRDAGGQRPALRTDDQPHFL